MAFAHCRARDHGTVQVAVHESRPRVDDGKSRYRRQPPGGCHPADILRILLRADRGLLQSKLRPDRAKIDTCYGSNRGLLFAGHRMPFLGRKRENNADCAASHGCAQPLQSSRSILRAITGVNLRFTDSAFRPENGTGPVLSDRAGAFYPPRKSPARSPPALITSPKLAPAAAVCSDFYKFTEISKT